MKHFDRDEWYFDGWTWCGITDSGEVWYPFSYGDDGRAWRMTKEINLCLNCGTINRVKKQIQAELKHSPVFFRHRYKQIYIVHIKEYPTFYFDYLAVARKHRIKLSTFMSQEDIVSRLTKYGFVPISDNPKIIEIGREEIKYEEFDIKV
jgi:hypothetical protein